MAKTRFFRVAVEGDTTDGRKIERQWLSDAAETYKPDTYTARINMEHIRGFSPEAPFNAYGSIDALKTEEVELEIAGKKEKRLALFAQVDALDPLVELNRKGQKLFTSIEIAPNFANSGKAYLVGLAVTDSPASLGTEMLQFAAQQGDKSPLAHRKQNKDNLFTAAQEVSIEIDAASEVNPDPTGIFASIKGLLDKFGGKPASEEAGQQQAQTEIEEKPAVKDESSALAAFGVIIGQLTGAIEASNKSTGEQIAKLTGDLTALTAKVETAPLTGFTQRTPATGGGQAGVRTDC